MGQTDKTILVVDDDEDFRMQQQMMLESAGYGVVTAENETQAMEIFGSQPFDAAIIDLMMSQQDGGFTLCRSMKKSKPELPIIMVTGVTSETGLEFDAATSEERSWIKADAFLPKPIRFEQLKKELDRLLHD